MSDEKITHRFESLESLQASLMPFVRDGGIFIPTEKKYHLGETVTLTLVLPNANNSFTFQGEVIWITPNSVHSLHQHTGVGFHCGGTEGESFQKAAQTLLQAVNVNVISETM